jgi:hypothetical protein
LDAVLIFEMMEWLGLAVRQGLIFAAEVTEHWGCPLVQEDDSVVFGNLGVGQDQIVGWMPPKVITLENSVMILAFCFSVATAKLKIASSRTISPTHSL